MTGKDDRKGVLTPAAGAAAAGSALRGAEGAAGAAPGAVRGAEAAAGSGGCWRGGKQTWREPQA